MLSDFLGSFIRCVLDLPEWSTVDVDASFGTFDATGAFMSNDVRLRLSVLFIVTLSFSSS